MSVFYFFKSRKTAQILNTLFQASKLCCKINKDQTQHKEIGFRMFVSNFYRSLYFYLSYRFSLRSTLSCRLFKFIFLLHFYTELHDNFSFFPSKQRQITQPMRAQSRNIYLTMQIQYRHISLKKFTTSY